MSKKPTDNHACPVLFDYARRWWTSLLVTALGVLLPVSAAWAEAEAAPPETEKPWRQWLFVVLFVALCCGIAFKNPKRTHQTST